jgi:aminopeptidase N
MSGLIPRAGALAASLVLSLAAPAAAGRAGVGSPGLSDPYFPLAGNGGYDVRHYSLDLDYVRAGNQLDATAVITARATQDLRRFDLDLRGFTISRLTVDGAPAAYARDGQELVITPRRPLKAKKSFVVRVVPASP